MNTPLSIQLYSLRTLPGLPEVLDTVKAAGYRNVELIGSHLDDAANVRKQLDARGLAVSSSHVSIAALRERFDAIMAACKTLGFTQLFMPAVPPDERQSVEPYWTQPGPRTRPDGPARQGARRRARLPQPPLGAERRRPMAAARSTACLPAPATRP